jgi:hypothetical protein
MIHRSRQIASDYRSNNGYDIPVAFLAQKVANVAQVYTQHAYMRPYGVGWFDENFKTSILFVEKIKLIIVLIKTVVSV